MPPQHFTIIELSGHIIDTLVLAKVIRALQKAKVSYQVNDFQLGHHKADTSTMQISVWAATEELLEHVLMEVRPLGAVPVERHSVKYAACPEDGVLPPGAHVRWNPPTQVLLGRKWIDVARAGCDHTIVVDVEKKTAELRHVADVRKGDRVVVGRHGLKVLPELE